MRLKTLLALALAAALGVVAAVAVAAPPPGKDKPERPAAAAKAEAKAAKKEAKATARAAKLAAKRLARLQAREEAEVLDHCRPRVSYVLKGEFVSAAAGEAGGSLVLLVKRSNKHAKAFVGKQATITIGERTRVRGGRKLAAAVAGDKVVAHVRACKDADESLELYAKQVVVTPKKAESGDDGEETGSTSTGTETTGTTTTESTTTGTTESTTTETTP